jgi:hypothetical protein
MSLTSNILGGLPAPSLAPPAPFLFVMTTKNEIK